MATFVSLLLLLSLTTGDLFLRGAAASALDSVCGKTTQPPRCKTLLESSDTRSQTATLPELGQIAIAAALDSAGEVKIKVHNLGLTARDPNLKSLYKNCENLYLSALDQLLIAREYLQKRSYGKLAAAAGVVGGDAGDCAAAAVKDGGLKQKNEDTRILADDIAVIARNLA